MATLRDLRLEAGLSVNRLAQLAKVDNETVSRAESGNPVQDVKAYAIVKALGKKLGQTFRLEDIDGLNIL